MIGTGGALRIVVATRPVDFRKGHDGLAAVAEHELGVDPHSGVAVVFRSKSGDRLKILLWDGTGLVLLYKRLEQGRFAWPGVPRRGDAPFAGAVRGVVRGSGLAPDVESPGAPSGDRRVRSRSVSWIVIYLIS